MKKLILPLLILFSLAGKAQAPVDLEKLNFNEDVKALLKDRKRHADPNEALTTLPTYIVYEVENFSYGPIKFSGKTDRGNLNYNSVSFLLNSVAEKKIVGVIIRIQYAEEAKKLVDYLMKKQGKPIELEPKPKPGKESLLDGGNNFLWKEFRPGYSMLMANDYYSDNKKQLFSTEIVMLKDSQPTAVPSTPNTALKRAILTFTNDRKAEL